MKPIALFLLLLLSFPVFAESGRWVQIGEVGVTPVYIDSSTIEQCARFTGSNCGWASGNEWGVVGGNITNGFKAWIKGPDFLGTVINRQVVVDCGKRKYVNGVPMDIAPESSEEAVFNYLCKKKG